LSVGVRIQLAEFSGTNHEGHVTYTAYQNMSVQIDWGALKSTNPATPKSIGTQNPMAAAM